MPKPTSKNKTATTKVEEPVTRVKIKYKPRKWQRSIHDAPHRYKVLVVHRRGGKTVLSINELIKCALLKPKSRYFYIAPTYKQAKMVAWDLLKEYVPKKLVKKINEAELYVRLINGSLIELKGADNPDSLRGIGLDGVVFDEYSQQPSNIFTEIIRPALADKKGWAIWIGTPKGKNEFYNLYTRAKGDDWFRILLTYKDTGALDEAEIENIKLTSSPDDFNQEFLCSWVPSIKGSYYAADIQDAREAGRITHVPYDPQLPVHTVWDLGVSDDTAIGFYQLAGREPRMIDFHSDVGRGLDHYIKNVLPEKEYHYGKHFAPHDIRVRELSTGRSRLETASKLGVDFEIIPNIPIKDGIDAGRLILGKMWIDEASCDGFLDALLQYRRQYDEKRGCFKDKPLHDWTSHAADVHRYFGVVIERMSNERQKAKQFKPKSSYY